MLVVRDKCYDEHTHLVLLQLGAEVGVDIFKEFNWFINNAVGGNKHRLPKVFLSDKVYLLSNKASSPGHKPTFIDVHHAKKTIKTSNKVKQVQIKSHN